MNPPEFLTGPGLVREAYEFARDAHEGQERKGDGSPYINHPVELVRILRTAGYGDDDELLAAALLHDTVEDTDTSLEEIEDAFGSGVRALVEAMSEDKSVEPWEEKKRQHREHVEEEGERAVLIYAADKLANLRDMRALYSSIGEGAASRFKASMETRLRVWRGDLEMIERVSPDLDLLVQLRSELDVFEAERATTA